MTEPTTPPLIALPDGGAELRVTLRLQWEDIAALGQEAGRLAAQWKRAVSLDEAASHRLRGRPSAAHAKPPTLQERGRPQPAVAPSSVSPLPARSPGEQARQAIEKITGGAGHESA
ncbi:hypothetical protein [Streptomyces chattanoogensis]|uniref:hypothetical protein n=1 Tax=Streptomyces chattanoogensis TaxID=66876 RepID=UPI0005D92E65|nr:hypothetical protein T261_0432 [Streptomyces lydicus]